MAVELPFKISTLIYLRNEADELLLLQRRKEPNKGLWSPIGGKLEMALGESPFEAARRETEEEIGLSVTDEDLHLFAMISEKHYEGRIHWLMFMFECRIRLTKLPPAMEEGHLAFFSREQVANLPVPATDREALWPLYFQHRTGFVSLRADCEPGKPLDFTIEQVLPA